jgi:hypothetical protein
VCGAHHRDIDIIAALHLENINQVFFKKSFFFSLQKNRQKSKAAHLWRWNDDLHGFRIVRSLKK